MADERSVPLQQLYRQSTVSRFRFIGVFSALSVYLKSWVNRTDWCEHSNRESIASNSIPAMTLFQTNCRLLNAHNVTSRSMWQDTRAS